MSLNELTDTSGPDRARGRSCVLVAVSALEADARVCLQSTMAHTPADVPIVIASEHSADRLQDLLQQCDDYGHEIWFTGPWMTAEESRSDEGVDRLTAAVERACSMLLPADIALLSEPCRVSTGWLERLREAARADTNTATASTLTDAAGALAVGDSRNSARSLDELSKSVAENTLKLRPQIALPRGPCVYLRGDARELVGALDDRFQLRWALELDFAQRCLLSGLAHVCADDVVVERLLPPDAGGEEPGARLLDLYPYLSIPPATAATGVLARALHAAGRPRPFMSVTIDARALTTTLTGTQRHVLELIRALADGGGIRLRLLVSDDTSPTNLSLLGSLPRTELLAIEAIDAGTPRSAVFHRPQQVFEAADLRLALRLGERVVLNQLDLIAYRNPGYHRDTTAWHSHRRVSRQALAAADRVVVFSEHTRSELLSDELAEEDRIRIIPPGLDHSSPQQGRKPQALTEPVASLTGSGQPRDQYLLCLGTDFRHKNRVFALRLLEELRRRHDWPGSLIFAGTHIPYGSSLDLERDYLAHHPELRSAVMDLGAIDEDEKSWLMSHSAAVVYPSTYEGFGLVPFEAGIAGVPCMFAPQSSLAEVLPREAAAIVPWGVVESAERAHALLSDPAQRARNVDALAQAARRLRWSDSAAAIVETYEEAAIAPVREAAALGRAEVEREQELRELIRAHDALVAQLATERAHAQAMYDELDASTGFALGLIGPNGALPEDVQRALLALSSRASMSRAAYGVTAGTFRVARRVGRGMSDLRRRRA